MKCSFCHLVLKMLLGPKTNQIRVDVGDPAVRQVFSQSDGLFSSLFPGRRRASEAERRAAGVAV